MDDIDLWRAAKLLVDEHGTNASGFAAEWAIHFHEAGDIEAEEVWVRIMTRVLELQRKKPADGETQH